MAGGTVTRSLPPPGRTQTSLNTRMLTFIYLNNNISFIVLVVKSNILLYHVALLGWDGMFNLKRVVAGCEAAGAAMAFFKRKKDSEPQFYATVADGLKKIYRSKAAV